MYLVDSNIWLEWLLGQDRANEAEMFLRETSPNSLFITDFAFHSIAVILSRQNRIDMLPDFVNDVFVNGDIKIVRLEASDIPAVVDRMREFGLDFDDAYQYVAVEKRGFGIVSFDADFDKTLLGRILPTDAL